MSFNGFMALVRDCRIDTVHGEMLSRADLQCIFCSVNSPDFAPEILSGSSVSLAENKARLLNRSEFLQVIVRMAIAAYPSLPASAAVSQLCESWGRLLPPEALHKRDEFRRKHCYVPLMDAALVRHETTLRALFAKYAKVNRDRTDELQSDRLVSCGEWLSLIHDLGMVRTRQTAPFPAKLIFLWSRLRCADRVGIPSERRMRGLSFEDFLEALVRLSETVS